MSCFKHIQKHLHVSPLSYVQSCQGRVMVPKLGSESQPGLVMRPADAWTYPGIPSQAEVSFRVHRAGGWQQHKAPLEGAGSCSMCTWRTSPGKKSMHFPMGYLTVLTFSTLYFDITKRFCVCGRLTRSRSIVLSLQSSCATTAWLAELVYSREATSLATCRRVFPSGSSRTPRVVSIGLR